MAAQQPTALPPLPRVWSSSMSWQPTNDSYLAKYQTQLCYDYTYAHQQLTPSSQMFSSTSSRSYPPSHSFTFVP